MSDRTTERSAYAIRSAFLTVEDCTRDQAERAARSIQRHALGLTKISHIYDCEVASEADDLVMEERELLEQ